MGEMADAPDESTLQRIKHSDIRQGCAPDLSPDLEPDLQPDLKACFRHQPEQSTARNTSLRTGCRFTGKNLSLLALH